MDVKDIIETVQSRWAEAMSATAIGSNYSYEPNKTISKLPYADMFFLGTPGVRWDLDNSEAGIRATVQVDIYTGEYIPVSTLYDLDAVSHAAMEAMGFRRTSGLSPDFRNTGYKRVTSRYQRVLGLADFNNSIGG